MAQRRINIRRAGLDETLSNLDIQVSISVQSPKFVRAKAFLSLRILGLDFIRMHVPAWNFYGSENQAK